MENFRGRFWVYAETHKHLNMENTMHTDINRPGFHLELVCDVQNLPFRDETFDIVYISHVLEHVDFPLKAVKELKRVTRKYVIVKVPNASHYKYMPYVTEASEHLYSWNSSTLKNLLSRFFPFVKIHSTTRIYSSEKITRLRTLKLILLLPLVSRNEITAICRKND